MNFSEEQLESLSRKIEEHENRARRIAWLVTVIPIILAGLLLAYTIQQISIKQNDLDQKTIQLADVNTKIPEGLATLRIVETAKSQLQTAEAQLQVNLTEAQATNVAMGAIKAQLQVGLSDSQATIVARESVFAPKACPIDEMVLKDYSSNYTPQVQTLLFLLNMQQKNIPWNPNGFSEANGFDSPNFALYVLQQQGLISSSYKPGTLPWEILPPVSSPTNGDIVYYQSGYTMFYYELPVSYGGQGTRTCVIGMTPLGILSLQMDFANRLGALKVYP